MQVWAQRWKQTPTQTKNRNSANTLIQQTQTKQDIMRLAQKKKTLVIVVGIDANVLVVVFAHVAFWGWPLSHN